MNLMKNVYKIQDTAELSITVSNYPSDSVLSVIFKNPNGDLSPVNIHLSGTTYSNVFRLKLNDFGDYSIIVKIMDSSQRTLEEKSLGFSVQLNSCIGDGTCHTGENYGNCPTDCPSGGKDGYCDAVLDGICDPDCKNGGDIDCVSLPKTGKASAENYPIALIIGVFFLISILSAIYFNKNRENIQTDQQE